MAAGDADGNPLEGPFSTLIPTLNLPRTDRNMRGRPTRPRFCLCF